MQRKNSSGNYVVKRKNKFLRIFILLVILAVVFSIVFFVYRLAKNRINNSNSVSALYEYWANNDIQKVYEISDNILDVKPLQNTARTFRGYSAFKLAISEPDDITQTQFYLDRAINDLRVALQMAKYQTIGQTSYVLGLAYFYKDKATSSHYYADLAVKYFELAEKNGYKSDDIPELLGLSYAELGETQKSLESFTEALRSRENDILLYNIAKQYYKSGINSVAKQYLSRTIELSKDDGILINSHNILGQIYIEEEKYDEAKAEFESILQKNVNSADAHYGLGVLYESQGDMAKARAEWRTCLRLQVNHPGALQKMSEIK